MKQPIAIAIDVGGTFIKFAAVATDGKILWEGKCPTEARVSASRILDNIKKSALVVIGELRAMGVTAACVGVGTPGVVDSDLGLVLGGASAMSGWQNIALTQMLSEATGLPTYADNDANLMGLGEYHFGENDQARHLIFLTIGTGIGGAIFLNGVLYRGHAYAAGELGSIMMNYEGEEAYWEEFASTAAMVRSYRKLQVEKADRPIDGKYIMDGYLKGEELATRVLKEHARLIGYGLSGYVNIFNPERIVIGGGISEAGDHYIDLIRAATERYVMPECMAGVEIKAAQLGNKAGFLGAAYLAFSRTGLLR